MSLSLKVLLSRELSVTVSSLRRDETVPATLVSRAPANLPIIPVSRTPANLPITPVSRTPADLPITLVSRAPTYKTLSCTNWQNYISLPTDLNRLSLKLLYLSWRRCCLLIYKTVPQTYRPVPPHTSRSKPHQHLPAERERKKEY